MDEELREGEPQGTREKEEYDYDLFSYASSQGGEQLTLTDLPDFEQEQGIGQEASRHPLQGSVQEQEQEQEQEQQEQPSLPAAASAMQADEEKSPLPSESASDGAAEEPPAQEQEKDEEAASEDEEPEDEAEGTEEMKISSDLIRGHINTIILRSLYDGDKYGYEIIAEIEKKSHGQYALKQPSLYSALKRLEREGYVTSYWGGSVGGGRRKYFSLTDDGKEIAEKNQSEWEYSRTVIDSLISDRDFDFNEPAPGIVDMRMLRRSTSRVPDRGLDAAEEQFEEQEDPALEQENSEMLRRQAEFEEQRAKLEEELQAREEDLRMREELFRAEEAKRNQALAEEQARIREDHLRRAEEEANRIRQEQAAIGAAERQAEEERLRRVQEARLQEEQALREAEARRNRLNDEIARREEEEAAHATALAAEKEQQNARILEMEGFIQERAQYEERLKQQEAKFRAQHERELAEQEKRIRAEDEKLFREREQQMIHQNYLNLMKQPAAQEQPPMFYDAELQQPPKAQNTAPQTASERTGYRSVIQRLFDNTLRSEEAPQTPSPVLPNVKQQPQADAAPPPPSYVVTAPLRQEPPVQREEAVRPKPVATRSGSVAAPKEEPSVEAVPIGKIDFYDLETRAAQDGIRINTSGGQIKSGREKISYSLVHKGRALFFSALVVFLMCIAEGSVALGLQSTLGLPRFFPYFIWGTGLALLLIAGLAYLNHYGERALRQTGNLLTNTIVTYALCVILVLIVALTARIDFTDAGQLASYVIFPIVYFFGVVIFGFVYYLQIRPTRDA